MFSSSRLAKGRPSFRHNVTVGLAPEGIDGSTEFLKAWAAQNLRWDAGWVSLLIVPSADVLS
jgi:hypothetical protein